jgi:hypothetical protein
MALPQRLYNLYRKISDCALVKEKKATSSNIVEFQDLLNESTPVTDEEGVQKRLILDIYHSNTVGFLKYVKDYHNRVSPLILYAETRAIVDFFELQGCIHLLWDDKNSKFVVSKYLTKEERHGDTKVARSSSTTRGNGRGRGRGGSFSRILTRGNGRGRGRGSDRASRSTKRYVSISDRNVSRSKSPATPKITGRSSDEQADKVAASALTESEPKNVDAEVDTEEEEVVEDLDPKKSWADSCGSKVKKEDK